MLGGLSIQTTARARSAAALGAAVLVGGLGAFDLARGSGSLALVLAGRALWIAGLLVAAWLATRETVRCTSLYGALAAIASIVGVSLLVYVDRGETGGSTMFLLAAPLFVVVLVPDIPVGILAAVASAIATALVFALLGRALRETAVATIRAAIAGGFAVFATALQDRVRCVEAHLAERLEQSEQLLARAAPLAATKARALAHDMSSPLATVKCNLEWLWEAAREGRLRADEPEMLEVLEDARAATDRLRKGVGELTQAARQAHGCAGAG